jgi:hypothetical protein
MYVFGMLSTVNNDNFFVERYAVSIRNDEKIAFWK